MDRFRNGTTQIITNCAILTEGFDCPDSSALIIARPTTSVTLWLQIIGRVLRPALGKDYATILDMTDNWFRLGRPCDNRKWSLDPISCEEETIGVRCCPSCHHVFKPMPALIRTFECFNTQRAEFITTYETDCPNCGKTFRWVLEEGRQTEGDGIPTIISTDGIEWQEVPPTVRPMLLRPIIELKKRKFRKTDNRFKANLEALKHWILSCPDVNMDELKYAVSLLEFLNLETQVINFLFLVLATKIEQAINWDDVLQITSCRPHDVKKAIWSKLSNSEKDRLNQMKYQYEKELKEWLTEENLSIVALDLEACENLEMFSTLWRIYNRQAIRLASKQVVSHKADQISEWIQQLDTVISNTAMVESSGTTDLHNGL